MIKYIILLFIGLAIAGRFWYNFRVKSGTGSLVKKLKSGILSPDSFTDVFDILLQQLSYEGVAAGFAGFEKIAIESNVKYYGRYKVQAVGQTDRRKAVIIGTVTAKQETQYTSEQIDIVLPCSLLIINDEDNSTLSYYSECPADKNHEFLIKDFIKQVHLRLTS
jgi:uncharacterized protein (DUF302 family)